MPLTRIEVCDFKGHQIIGPFGTFTSVIGPNGAGKSNLMDAISFVLGVKSVQLRSSQLKDLIYRGRRLGREGDPAQEEEQEEEGVAGEGTAQKAWVLAVYEDGEGKEWKFQRTISTSGSSEYRLNNKVVTYQAYNHALEKQNILVKAKNFLVFQGDVEAVASQSAKDLARLIEQISGSLELAPEYDRAKSQQDRATENATFNFNKRRGIAGEIKQFKEQKSEAERFETLCSERDTLIMQRLLWKLFHIEEKIEDNFRAINAQNTDIVSLRADQKDHDEKLAEAREDQAKARSEVSKRERRIRRQEKAMEAKQPAMVALEAQIAHFERRLKSANELAETVQKDAEKQEQKLEILQNELASVQKAANAAQEISRKTSSKSLALSEESLEEYRKLKAAANIQEVETRQQLETRRRDEKTQGRALTSLNEKIAHFEERKTKLDEEKVTQSTKKAELQEQLEKVQDELKRAKRELENTQSERTRVLKLEAEINEKLQECHNKLLQAGVDQKESEKEARRKETFASLQRIFPGVRGRVIDLCQPTQRKYEAAVSVILGRNIDALVVDQEKTAIDCIEFMRNQRAGQATFIPLDTIQVKPINDKFRSFAKGARLALDCIQFEPAVERAMHHACGNALVCDTMEVARYVCYDKGQEVKAVTLEGTIIHKSGLITGGRSTHHNNKKWEEKDVQGLHRQRDKLFAELRELNKSKPRGKADENIIAEINRLESSLLIVKDDLTACEHKLTGIKDELKHVNQELKKHRPEQAKLQASHSQLQNKISELAEVVNVAEDKIFGAFCRKINVSHIREYEERQLKVSQEENEARVRFDTQIARLTHQTKFEQESLKTIQDRFEMLQKAAVDHTTTLAELAVSKQAAQAEVDESQNAIEVLQEELKGFQEDLEEKTTALDNVKRIASKASKALDKALKDIATKNDEIEKLASERSGIYRKCRLEEIPLPLEEGNLKNVPMEENLRGDVAMDVDEDEDGTQRPKQVDNYGIQVDFSSLDDDERQDGSADAGAVFDNSISKLAAEIERMAPNMKAMEKLDDVQAKLAETEKEADKARKDSKSARDEFNEIRKQRCDLFNKAYNHISQCIDQVYKDLTRGKAAPMGGVAYLSLEDNEEPYLGGIKYHAMPPMKRFRDMEQLSGGEKTVAALALLFAIHSYQPSPFFVLDEVDAALDNTNVAKIANYIRNQASDKFQFVVISLKGSLYERGNSLVGIYRDQDVNSSRTLTLELTQYDN
ncbi:condensin complex subunit SMC1 [Hysterangium stoloniferum]|nr:condensin complex subunit SMC1 [Hysterangium stoloniferum]